MSAAIDPIDLASEADIRLGHLLVRPSLRTVEADGRPELLEPRVMQVLVALARADGAVVSRDTLIARCWSGRVVGDDAINRCIGKIRQVANLGGQGAFVVETVSRVGYRLRGVGGDAAQPTELTAAPVPQPAAAVEIANPAARGLDESLVPPAAVVSVPWHGRRRRWPIVVATLLGCLVVGGGVLLGLRLFWPSASNWAVATSEALIATSLREAHASIAHDGTMIAYDAGKDFLHRGILLKRAAGGDPLPVTHDDYENVWPSWSPDDSQIAFAQIREDGNCHLMIVAVPVGTPREVARCKAERASKVVWSASANTIFFEDYLGKGQHKQIWQLDLTTGATKAVTSPDHDMLGYAVSADGHWLAYLAAGDNNQNDKLILRDLGDQSERILSTADYETFAFSSDGQSLWVSRTSEGDYGLSSIALQNGRETRFFSSPVALQAIAGGPNGMLAAQVGFPEVDLVRVKPGDAPHTVFGERIANVAPDVASNGAIAWFHRQVAYAGVFVQGPDGKAHELIKLANKDIELGIPVWSPDAGKLAILASEDDVQDILVISAAGTILQRFAFPDRTLSRPAWYADGNRLLVAVQKDDNSELWQLDLSSGTRTMVSAKGDWIDLKSRGDMIFGTRGHVPGVWTVSDTPRQVSLRPGDVNPFAWAIRGDTIAYVDLLADGPKVMAQDMAGGASQRLLDIPDIWPASWYDFAVDPTNGDLLYARDNGDIDIELFRLVQK